MGITAPDADFALQLYQSVLRSLAYVLIGAAIIAVVLYVVLLCSEVFAPKVRSKASSSALAAVVTEINRSPSVVEMPTPEPATAMSDQVLEMPAPQEAAEPDTLRPVRARKKAQRG